MPLFVERPTQKLDRTSCANDNVSTPKFTDEQLDAFMASIPAAAGELVTA